jgi:hypothetical protein
MKREHVQVPNRESLTGGILNRATELRHRYRANGTCIAQYATSISHTILVQQPNTQGHTARGYPFCRSCRRDDVR